MIGVLGFFVLNSGYDVVLVFYSFEFEVLNVLLCFGCLYMKVSYEFFFLVKLIQCWFISFLFLMGIVMFVLISVDLM